MGNSSNSSSQEADLSSSLFQEPTLNQQKLYLSGFQTAKRKLNINQTKVVSKEDKIRVNGAYSEVRLTTVKPTIA